MAATATEIGSQLSAIVGQDAVRTDAEVLQRFGVDRTSFWSPAPTAVVLPGSIEEVQQLVQLANRERLAIVPSGGRTGLSGGAVASRGEIVLSLARMHRLLAVSPVDATITCEAGMTTARVQQYASEQGLYYPVNYAVVDQCAIGGNIATNAGGIKVIRYGSTRDWVLGLRVVTGEGEILDLNAGLVKNNSGYDLRHLWVGSEGTLGVICEATLRLTRKPRDLCLLALGVQDFGAVLEVLHLYRQHVELTAFEFFCRRALRSVQVHAGLSVPFRNDHSYYALVEFDRQSAEELHAAKAALAQAIRAGCVQEAFFAADQQQFADFWRMRTGISESLAIHTPYKNDLSVRVSKMPAFMQAAEVLVAERYREFEVVWFGHIGDGNLHLNVLRPDSWPLEKFVAACSEVNRDMVQLVSHFGGSISAEHGIGLLKKKYLPTVLGTAQINLMRQIKRAFDPNGIMNPGKIFDA